MLLLLSYYRLRGFPGDLDATESAWFDPWVGKSPWRREWLSTPLFLPGESHAQRSLVGYSPQGHEELDVTEKLTQTHINYKNTPKFGNLKK